MTDPYTPSDEAIAAYPYNQGGRDLTSERTAFDRGVAATRAQQYAATRESLEVIRDALYPWFDHDHSRSRYVRGDDPSYDERQDHRSTIDDFIEALLASGGPLVDVREVQAEVIDWQRAAGYEDAPSRASEHFGIEARA